MPKVSVILTSFNHDKYLCEAIESVLNQTFTDFELIIWDDASSDNSWYLINQYTDPRIKTFRNEQQKRGIWGVNKAISEVATGEYIAIHHSDDVWELTKLDKQVAFLNANTEIGAVFTWVQIIDEHSEEKENDDFNQENKTRWQWLQQLFAGDNHLNHPSVLIKKQCYQNVGGYRYGLAQTGDAEMWSRVLIKYPIHVIQERLTKHRRPSDHSNTSGPRVDAEIRTSNEWNIIRENFLALTEFEEIVAIFPSLERYRNPAGCDHKFLLAMACLYESKQRNAWQLGLNWLFELLNDAARHKKITELYAFSYADLIKLTGEFDVFSMFQQHEFIDYIEAQRQEIQAYAEQDHVFSDQIQTQIAVIAELNTILHERNITLNERNITINELNTTLHERNITIIELNTTLHERNITTIELNTTLHERNITTIELNTILHERNITINELNTTLHERNITINELNTILHERNITINELNTILHERNITIIELNTILDERNITINELNTILDERDETIHEICTSRSWRFTRPLRLLYRLIRDPRLLWSQLHE